MSEWLTHPFCVGQRDLSRAYFLCPSHGIRDSGHGCRTRFPPSNCASFGAARMLAAYLVSLWVNSARRAILGIATIDGLQRDSGLVQVEWSPVYHDARLCFWQCMRRWTLGNWVLNNVKGVGFERL